MDKADTQDQLEHSGYILVRDNKGTVYERLEGNTNWWIIGSLKARNTKEIELPVTILIKE